MRNKAFRNFKLHFTVVAVYPSGKRRGVFRVQSEGNWKTVTEKFEAAGFTVLGVHRDGDGR